jgi:hypothetical protein
MWIIVSLVHCIAWYAQVNLWRINAFTWPAACRLEARFNGNLQTVTRSNNTTSLIHIFCSLQQHVWSFVSLLCLHQRSLLPSSRSQLTSTLLTVITRLNWTLAQIRVKVTLRPIFRPVYPGIRPRSWRLFFTSIESSFRHLYLSFCGAPSMKRGWVNIVFSLHTDPLT